jgi:hypothetical protein
MPSSLSARAQARPALRCSLQASAETTAPHRVGQFRPAKTVHYSGGRPQTVMPGSRRLRGFRRHYPVSPKASDPDRSVGVTALEGDPHVRTIRREVKPSTGIRIRRARHRPPLFILSEDVRDEHTKSSIVHWIEVANYLSSVQAEEALSHHSVWFRAVGRGPFPLPSPDRR